VYSSSKAAVAVAAGEYYQEYQSEEDMIREGKAVLQMTYFDDIFTYRNKKFQYDDEPTFIGFPTTQGNGSAIMGNVELALSAKSKNSEGAWQFIKYFLSDDYQKNISYGFPIKKSRLDELGEAAMKPYSWTDQQGNVYEEPRTIWTNGQSVEIGNMTQEEVDKVKNFIMSVDTVMRYDTTMMNIITEEADAFFTDRSPRRRSPPPYRAG
jgi:ABC-type glycerol-3-phosphate transport system substrate-binding protein